MLKRSSSLLAKDRTDLAEDRTLLANERTFSGWVRTSLATVGIGLGFIALFGTLQPMWVPKAIATLFICLGILIILMATGRACQIISRLPAHPQYSASPLKLKLIAGIYCTGAVGLITGIWLLV
jgi:putative membrane protein